MPWKDTCPMDQRVAFIADWLRDEWTMSELAVRYGISRKTAYKWIDRYERDPEHGLAEHSRAPKQHGRAMAENVRAAVRALRRAHPRWGPRKLRAILMERDGRRDWPAASTIGDLLRREGLSAPRRRRREIVPLTQPLAAAQTPNDVWTADFKGWFRTTDGTRCDPLTVIDACSRFVLCCRIVAPTERGVRPWFERTFREYGLPRAMRTDNGPPFATTAAAHLSPLAIWWLKLGIQLDRIDRGHPEQNGRHERFHLTLQESTTTPPAATSVQQQRRFDRLRSEFNTERPHEALGQQPPARVYVASPRPYPARLEEPSYDASHQVAEHTAALKRAIAAHGVSRPESRDTRELEAEAVAFVVGQAVGLEAAEASRDYIQLYRGDATALAASLDRIQRAASSILQSIRPADNAISDAAWSEHRRRALRRSPPSGGRR